MMFTDSSNTSKDNLTEWALLNFDKSAQKNKGKLLYCECDVAIDDLCLKMLHRFDILREELPLVRIVQNMDIQKKVFFKFKLKPEDVAANSKGFENHKTFELSENGMNLLAL